MAYYYRATSGLGQDPSCTSVPYVTSTGQSGAGNLCADDSGKCGDMFALQQALNYLGYGPLEVDGMPGAKTFAAIKNYADAKGVNYPGSYPGYEVCAPLVKEYAAESAPPASAPAAVAPKSLNLTAMKMPRLSKTIAAGAPRSGTTSTSPAAPPPGGSPAAETQPVPAQGFWAGLPDWQKYAIIGGAVLAVGGGAYFLISKKRRPAVATPNARRRHMTKQEAEMEFVVYILPEVKRRYEQGGHMDKPARREAWNNYTNDLHRHGLITDRQYDRWLGPKSAGR